MDIKTILESKESIETLTAKDMPISVAIKISKIQRELSSALEIYQKKRTTLFEKYGEGEDLHIPEANKEVFLKEHEELITEDTGITVEQIPVADLGNIEIAPNHLTNLDWLLV